MSLKQNDIFQEHQDEIQEDTTSMEEKLEALENPKNWKVEKTDGGEEAYREHQSFS